MTSMSRYGAVALVAVALGGCQAISGALNGGGGVMPDTDVGPPPSMRGALPQKTRAVDPDAAAAPSTPSRSLALPKNVRGETRSADAGPRRIDRDDIEGGNASRSSSGDLSPQMTPGGKVGLGGRF